MQKLDYIYRPVKIEDYNRVVDVINSIIDELSEKKTVELSWVNENVKDIRDLTQLDISLPYERSLLIADLQSLNEFSMKFNLPYELSKEIMDYLSKSIAVNLNINFKESQEVKDVIISQGEISLEVLEKSNEDVKPKTRRKKKDGTAKPTGDAPKKNSRANKGRVSKKKS